MDRFRYKITIQYDGTRYHGWQIQKNHVTIQSEIEKGIKDLCSQKTSLYGSGRTDSGVHAIGQVAHFDLSEKIEPKIQNEAEMLNILGSDIFKYRNQVIKNNQF